MLCSSALIDINTSICVITWNGSDSRRTTGSEEGGGGGGRIGGEGEGEGGEGKLEALIS